jgi:hypothetical protein
LLSPFFGRGLLLESSRWGKRTFTGFEGILSSKEALQVLGDRYSIFKKSVSPTRLEALEKKYDAQFKMVFDTIRELMRPPQPKKRPIGFLVEEPKVPYITRIKRKS